MGEPVNGGMRFTTTCEAIGEAKNAKALFPSSGGVTLRGGVVKQTGSQCKSQLKDIKSMIKS